MRISNTLKTVGVVGLVGVLLIANQFIFNDGFSFSSDDSSAHAHRKMSRHRHIELSGKQTTENRELGSFTKIKVGGAYTIKLVRGDKAGISLTGDSELLQHISTDVADGTLQVKLNGKFKDNNDIELVITYDKLNSIRLSGANELSAAQAITTDKLELHISGASKANLEVQADAIETEVHGAGDIELKGKVKTYTAEVHGAGNIEAYDLLAENVNVQLSGAGHANVFATQMLDARVSGVGHISYKGKPANKKLKNSGMSSISEG